MIRKECLISFEKLILVGPWYLTPLIEGIYVLFFINFAIVPEKLTKIFLLETIFMFRSRVARDGVKFCFSNIISNIAIS